ncbi:MAG: glycosyltransferase family 4 protein [Actinomycetota bacterium]|nr:glycosyltransferase family 4 protein [Actinomycetota bacterium]MEC8334988.1 glycosyltransferase family 4 protein [Actinomycetota bacterium]
MSLNNDSKKLRIAMLAYRGKPHVGGQGVYVREMSKALVELGHTVEVFGGPPYPDLDDKVPLHKFPSLEIFNDHYPGRIPGFWEIKDYPDFVEVCSYLTGNFSEPLSFSMRAFRALKQRSDEFDLVIDNGSLAYGNLKIQKKLGLPILGIIHHPITVDRRLELDNARTFLERLGKRRWYAFTRMQTRVCQKIQRIITVSESSKEDISHDHKVDINKIHVVPIGIDTDFFAPQTDIERIPGRIVSTASADVPLKGQKFLLEAIAKVRDEFPHVHLELVGKQREGSTTAETLNQLGLDDIVRFNQGISYEELVNLLASAEVAIVPSLYEGFSIPAIEALSCGAPLIASTGGALPEVAGPHLETCLAVPPGDSDALADQIKYAFQNPDLCRKIGLAGRQRVIEKWSWRESAITTAEHCRSLLSSWKTK